MDTTSTATIACCTLASATLAVALFASFGAPEPALQETSQVHPDCDVDLSSAGQMADIVSNALNRGLDKEELEVRAFLKGANDEYVDGQALLEAAAERFGVTNEVLWREVERYRHCNCTHEGGELVSKAAPFELTEFAADVTLHVVLHELGHALIREFDLPVLGNEETVADAFATHYLTTYLPDRAVDVLVARTTSLMIEAGDVPREEWTVRGEHNSDARRAYQIAALAVATDRTKYRAVAGVVGMTDREMRSAADYGAEIHRSWRRTLAPLWMPDGLRSSECRVSYDSGVGFCEVIRSSELSTVVLDVMKRFDWHSQVTVRFDDGEGGAGWSRSKRTVTVHSEYVQRFVEQGRLADRKGD